ncbi:MAG: ABC transporter permease [Nitrospinota bacterium]
MRSQGLAAAAPQAEEPGEHRSLRAIMWARLRRHRVAMAGGVFIVLFVLAALAAPLLSPHGPLRTDLQNTLAKPSLTHPFGTDHFGRDVLSRVVHGARISLLIGVVSVTIGAAGGILLGLVAGYFGGAADTLIMRVVDVMLTFPRIMLAILLIAIIGTGIANIMVAVGVFSIPTFARLVRSSVLGLRETEFVEAARAIGNRHRRVIFRHIFPNTLGPIIVQFTFLMATSIRVASTLSFLGIGVDPPTPEWGAMLADARAYMHIAPHLLMIPGLTLMGVVFSLNLFGDGLRDALDPRLRA